MADEKYFYHISYILSSFLRCSSAHKGYPVGASKAFKLNQVQNKIVTDFGIVAHTLFQADIAFHKGNHGCLSSGIVNPFVKLLLDFFFLFPQFLQISGIDSLPFASNVCIAVLINQVFSGSLLSAGFFLYGLCVSRTLSNSFPWWKEPWYDITIVSYQGLFSHHKFSRKLRAETDGNGIVWWWFTLKLAKRDRQLFSGFTYLLRMTLRFCQIDNKKTANLFQTYCFRWPPVTVGIRFWKFGLDRLMNNSINLRLLFFLKWSNKQHHHYNDI